MIDQALVSLRPGAVWTLNGFEYSGLDWQDETQTKPTEEEINAEIERIKIEVKAEQQAAIDAKQAAQDKLAKLGLTPDDLKAILG